MSFPFSKIKYEISIIIQKEGFVGEVEKKGRKEKRTIKINLKPDTAISGIKKISRPGQRIYVGAKDIKPVRGGYGILIISTPKGLMIGKEAKKQKLGGELICEIY